MQLSSITGQESAPVARGLTRGLAAILSADIAGYTGLMARDEEGTHARERRLRRDIINPSVADHRGRIVKHTGDGFLAVFGSPTDAVQCAIEMQRRVALSNSALPREEAIEFRIGINIGDVIVEPEDVFGDGVNVAARLQSIAEPGGIFVSASTYAHVKNTLDCAWAPLGERRLKNMPEPVRIYRLVADAATAARSRRQPGSGLGKRVKLWGISLAAIVAAATAGTIFPVQIQGIAATPPQSPPHSRHELSESVSALAEPRGIVLSDKHCPFTPLDHALKVNPRDGNAFLRRGLLHVVAREYHCGIADFDRVVQLSPGDVNALNNRCWAQAIVGRLSEALADCDEALRLRPNFSGALDSRGLTHLKSGRYDRAIADYDAALRQNPQQAESWYGRGIAKFKTKDAAGAHLDTERAKEINPGIAEEFMRYGVPRV
jgi:class 3 adenylate cyclase